MISKWNALRLVRGAAVTLTLMTAVAFQETDAQSFCDGNYGETPGGCVPGDRDYDCPELHAMGIGDIPVIGTDWQRLDGYQDFYTGEWLAYPDGVGCEWYGE